MAIDPRDGRPVTFTGAALALVLLTTGCATPPDVDALVDQAATTSAAPNMVGARGPLSDRQSKAILSKLQQDSQNATVLERHLALEAAVDDAPLVAGNKVTLLRDGKATIPAMFAAMRSARTSINLEYFIFDDIEDNGARLSGLLIDTVRRGVEVNVIYDSIGSDDTPTELFDRLKAEGVHFVDFHPASPLDGGSPTEINDRDHRKILIVDGRAAFVGGVNLSKVYMTPPTQKFYAGEAAKREITTLYWRDTDVEVEGPIVAQLQHYLTHDAHYD